MKKAAISYFSGTGNTAKAVALYKDAFEKQGIVTELIEIVKQGFIPDPANYDYFGIAYPVHGFNAPEPVLGFVKKLPVSEKINKYFIIKTSGEPLKLNDSSSYRIIEIMTDKNYLLQSEHRYVAPYNIIFRHTEETASNMFRVMEKLCPADALAVINGKEEKTHFSKMQKFISMLFGIEHRAVRLNGKYYKADKKLCLKCGRCARNCPTDNIKFTEEKLVFGDSCVNCARCSFYCPTNAISTGILNRWKVNGAYKADKIYSSPVDCVIGEGHENYCKKSYLKYFSESEKRIIGSESNVENEINAEKQLERFTEAKSGVAYVK